MCIKCFGIWTVENRAVSEALWQVGVGDEELAESNSVSFSCRDNLLSLSLGIFFVGDIDTAEGLLQVGAEAVVGIEFAGHQERQLALA